MKKVLITILGKGQSNLAKDYDRQYRKANYYLSFIDSKKYYETSFVAEAIINLTPAKFDEIHIFGTKQSMWEELYLRSCGGDLTDEEFQYYDSLIEQITDKNDLTNLGVIEKKFEQFNKLKTHIHIIPLGIDENEIWHVFAKFFSLDLNNSEVSIDITHGLRYQPIVLLLTLFYYNQIYSGKIGKIYYGALELAKGNEPKPILDFTTFIEMIEWINAAGIFSFTGNSKKILNLMEKYGTDEEISQNLKLFTTALQLNTPNYTYKFADKFVQSLEKINNPNTPLFFLKDNLINLPKKLNNIQLKSEMFIILAENYLKNHNYGYSVIAAYNSIIYRFSEILFIDNPHKFDNNNYLNNIIKNSKWKKKDNNFINGMFEALNDIKKTRNQIAHEDDNKTNTNPEHLLRNYRNNLMTIKNFMYSDKFAKKVQDIYDAY